MLIFDWFITLITAILLIFPLKKLKNINIRKCTQKITPPNYLTFINTPYKYKGSPDASCIRTALNFKLYTLNF